jgi:hypothetical protein
MVKPMSFICIVIIIIIIYFQILKLHMVLLKLEMIQANTKLFLTEKKSYKLIKHY